MCTTDYDAIGLPDEAMIKWVAARRLRMPMIPGFSRSRLGLCGSPQVGLTQ
jgi:hypothetical protein